MKIRHLATCAGVAAGAGALPALAFAPTAGAAPAIPDLPDLDPGRVIDGARDRVADRLPTPPAVPAPVVPAEGALPVNLLRKGRDSQVREHPIAHVPAAPRTPAGDVTIDDLNTAAVRTEFNKAIGGDFTGIITAFDKIRESRLVTDPAGVAADARAALDAFDPATATRTAGRENLTQWINGMTVDPVGTLARTVVDAGGPAALADPAALVRAVVGPEYAADLGLVVGELVVPFLTKDIPLALAAGLATLLLTPILSAIPGAILGASIGGLGASALALAVLATVVFGTWLLALGAVFVATIPLAIAVGVIIFFITAAAGLFINPLAYALGIGAGFSTAIFLPILITGAFAVFTVWIPVLVFGLLAPPLLLGALALGGIPGALIGGTLGFGAGMLAAGPLAALVTALVGNYLWQRRWDNNPDARDALDRLRDLWDRAFAESEIGKILRDINDAWGNSILGRIANMLGQAWAKLWAGVDPDAIRDGAIKGGLAGILAGILTGFPQGALATALATLPLLLGALAATLIPPLALAVAATFAVGIGLWLIPFLAVAPIWALGILAVGALLFAGALGIIAAGALIAVAIIFAIPTSGFSLLLLALVPVALGFVGLTWGIAGFLAGVGGVLATVFFILLLASLALAAITVGIPVFLLTAPLFVFPALALLGPLWLLGVLSGGALAAAVGAIFGAGTGGILGALAGLLRSLDVRGAAGVIRDGVPEIAGHISGDPSRLPDGQDFLALPAIASAASVSPYAGGTRRLVDVADLMGDDVDVPHEPSAAERVGVLV